MPQTQPLHEMIDQAGRVRSVYQPVAQVIRDLGATELERRAGIFVRDINLGDGGLGALPPAPGEAQKRYDLLPAVLKAGDFARIEAALIQRAGLMARIIDDLYGPARLLHEAVLPPALVFADPGFIRPVQHRQPSPVPRLLFYAADVIRRPDGSFAVIADHTGITPGLGHALGLRRRISALLPELFGAMPLRALRVAREGITDRLSRLAGSALVAVVAPGRGATATMGSDDHLFLARALGALLVEPADLAVRGGAMEIKTIAGLRRVPLLLRAIRGFGFDPLEQGGPPDQGIPGAFGVMRAGAVRVVNAPGTALAGRLARLPDFDARAATILGTDLALPTQCAPAPEDASVAMFGIGPELMATPVCFRFFAWAAEDGWQVVPGGLAMPLATLPPPTLHPQASHQPATPPSATPIPTGPIKDLWVMEEDEPEIRRGPALAEPHRGTAHLGAALLPSRIADDLFWLGRGVERLDGSARLLLAAIPRLEHMTSLPRDAAERSLILQCLARSELLPLEMLTDALSGSMLRAALARRQPLGRLLREVRRLLGRTSGRFSQSLAAILHLGLERVSTAEADGGTQAITEILGFTASFAGIAAENMSRDGGWLFLESGRRLERGGMLAESLAILLDAPPPRLEPGLAIGIELTDSVLTYDLRHGGVVRAAPAIELVLTDPANPRSLGFQMAALVAALERLSAHDHARTALVLQHRVSEAARTQTDLSATLRDLAQELRQLSNRVQTRFFAHLPEPHRTDDDIWQPVTAE